MITLYNTLTRRKAPLTPLRDNTVSLYACGLTVYSQPHIGNWVGYIYWDTLVRLLRHEGYVVHHVQNITDVGHLTSDADDGDDKMEKGARAEGKTAWDIAEKYSAIAEHEAYDILGLTRPELRRATDYIAEQIAFAEALEAKGLTYLIPGNGLYFDTSKLANYGQLARLDIAGLAAGARVCATNKRQPTDFAIWKLSPTDRQRDMEWDSPWGRGFPGWHLECSTIVQQSLGEQIDIHCGGIDHIPVHHCNEIAQTESVTGKPLAQVWLHNNHIKVDGRKMSKSLGNIVTLSDVLARGFDAPAFKLAILSKHYRTEGNFTWDILAAAQARLNHWRAYAALRHQTHDTLDDDDDKDEQGGSLLAASRALVEALSDDLDTPRVVALIDSSFSRLDTTPLPAIHRASLVQFITTIDELLGLSLAESTPDVTDDIKRLLLQRQRARDEKDWATSDALRDTLADQGIAVRDTPSGQIWHYV
ncbi:MAG: cysteine--tRNA ligase [Candidatus Saccharibacteria bacterium]|nr:cysteine--tRNA ligase [Candidatus Saccharibacteria bacterium]